MTPRRSRRRARRPGALLALALLAGAVSAHAAPPSPTRALEGVRAQIGAIEHDLLEGRESQLSAAVQLRKIKKLLSLQQKEIQLSKKRVLELSDGLGGLSVQKQGLLASIAKEKVSLRAKLVELAKLTEGDALDAAWLEDVDAHNQKTYFLSKTLGKELASVQRLHDDVAQAQSLEGKILEERNKLDYYVQELGSQMAMLGANELVQKEIVRTRSANRLDSLRKMRSLRESEHELESLIASFREKRLQDAVADRAPVRALPNKESAILKASPLAALAPTVAPAAAHPARPETSPPATDSSGALETMTLADLKGRLPLPVEGRVASAFGRSYNSKTNLLTFQKGITLAAQSGASVRAVSAGRVVFAGPLRNYGLIAIVEHPGQYYTLYGQMGTVAVKEGAVIKQGDVLGKMEAEPLYFEIRSRNVAVNPSQWLKI